MNGAIVFIIGLITGMIGGFVACFIYDLKNEAVKRTEFEEFKKTLDFALDDFNNNVITEISDIRNDLGKAVWLDDLTIKGINDHMDQISNKVDDHMRWSLGLWNDISHEDTTKIREKLGVPEESLPDNWMFNCMGPLEKGPIAVGPDGSRWFQDSDKQGWTEETKDA